MNPNVKEAILLSLFLLAFLILALALLPPLPQKEPAALITGELFAPDGPSPPAPPSSPDVPQTNEYKPDVSITPLPLNYS